MMKISDKGRSFLKYLFWYTIVFAAAAAGVFVWFLIAGKSLCWTLDTSSQYVPKAVYFISWVKEIVKGLLHGQFRFQMYDFSIGMGDSVPLHFEPVYWLFLLFHQRNIEFAYGFLIILRFYLSGLSISIFFLYFGLNTWQSLTGSMVYVFSGYGLFAGMRHSHFIIPMIMLPVLLLGMEEIYRKKRWYICTVTVAVSILCGYYFTYMNTIIMGVYFLIRFFGGKQEKSVREFIFRMRTIIGSYLLGLAIGNITFFNTFAGYLTSSRTGAAQQERVSMLHYDAGWIAAFFKDFLTASDSPGFWLWLGFIPLSYVCVILLFMRKGRNQLKAAFITGTVFAMIPAFGYVLSGFGSLNNRWCYAYTFVVALITAVMSEEFHSLTKREGIVTGVLCLPYLWFGLGARLLGRSYNKAVLAAGLLLVCTVIWIIFLRNAPKLSVTLKRMGLILCTVGLVWCSGALRFLPMFGDMIGEFTGAGKVWDKATGTELIAADMIEDDSFYRCYTKNSYSDVQGASMMLDYNGVVYYSSTLGKPMIDLYRELGLTSWSLVRLRGFDGRGYPDALASVKYQIIDDKEPYDIPYGYEEVKTVERNGRTLRIYENKNALPIGYCYDAAMMIDEFEELPCEERQEVLLQRAVVEDPELADMTGGEAAEPVVITGREIPVTKMELSDGIVYKNGKLKVKEKNASVTLYFDGLENCETYVNLKNLHRKAAGKVWFDITSDSDLYDISYCYHGDKNAYNTGQEDYIFNLGYTEEKKTFCRISFRKKCTLYLDGFSVYCQPMEALDGYTERLKENVLENVTLDTNTVRGTVKMETEEILVLSIPYQSGWSAWVDGVKTPLRKVNVMYMGIPLTPGEHEILLKFEIPGIRISLMITAAALVIFAAALLLRRKRQKNS